MINTRKIKGRMQELGVLQADVAKTLGLAEPTVSQKINGKRPMDLDEAKKLAQMLNIDKCDFGAYFFSI
jgi:predicted transcriptional regulator